jgi:transposase
MKVDSRVGTKVFRKFLKRLLHNAEHMIFLIVDGHPAHKAKRVATFVESMKDGLLLFFLPTYSPELNPDEGVWNDLKNNAIGRQHINSPRLLHKAVISH